MTFQHVFLSFGDKNVLKDFSLSLDSGKVTCLMGPSGCGKSTVLNLMMGLIHPDSGTISGFSQLSKGVVFQEDRLIPHMDAWDNVLLTAASDVRREDVSEAFEAVRLIPGHTRTSNLSGGQKRRVALVRAVMARPQLLLLDEPFKGLDPDAKKRAAEYIGANASDATIVLCAHEKEEALLIGAERFVLM